MSNIRVRLKSRQAIRTKLRPQQGVKVDNQKLYLYDPSIVDDEVELAKDWATKTDGLVEEEDYSSKAWAIGGQGTETNNSKYYASQAATSAGNAYTSETNAAASASTATTQAGIATTQAGIATTKAGEAAISASTATTQAGIATTQAGIATTKAGEASTSATNSSTSAGNALTYSNNASASATAASNSATSASNSADLSKQWAIGVPTEPADGSAKYWAGQAQSAVESIGDATLTIQKNGSDLGTFTANATVDKTIDIPIPTTAAEVNALPDTTKYGATITASLNTTDYKLTLTLKDQNGNTLGTAQVIDFPIESVVVNGAYDSVNKKIVLTLQNGTTIDIPVGDLISGLQTEITSSNKLDADLVDDSTSTNKFVTATDITTWNGKQDALSAGTGISISSNTVSVADPVIVNNGTGTKATALGKLSESTAEGGVAVGYEAKANSTYGTAIGYESRATNTNTTAVGKSAKALAQRAIAIGSGAEATANDAIAIKGINSTANTFQVYTYNMLDMSTGLIPDARISTNIARTSQLPAIDQTYDGTSANAQSGVAIAGAGFLTGITSGDVTTALGYTPYDSANPSGYITSSALTPYVLASSLATVATSGDYDDLINKPTIPAAQIQSDWTQADNTKLDYIKNKPTLASVATSGDYDDLINKPTIPTDTSDLTNGAGFITGITSSDVTTALGYTPYNSTNPNGYITSSALSGYATENYVDTGLSGKQATLVSGTNIKTVNNQSLLGSGNITIGGAVDSVNGQTGAVVLTASDVGALPDSTVIPTVNNSAITLTQGGVTKGSFTLNQSTGATIDFDAGGGSVTTDGTTINTNSSDELQAIGIINSRDSSTAIKTWTGTKAQYDAIVTKDANTLYNITDDTDVTLSILEAVYPVGSIYITTANTCPLSTLISGSTWVLQSSGVVTGLASTASVIGNGKNIGWTTGSTEYAGVGSTYSGVGITGIFGNDQTSTLPATGTGIMYQPAANVMFGLSTNAAKSGVIADLSSAATTLAVNIFERTA